MIQKNKVIILEFYFLDTYNVKYKTKKNIENLKEIIVKNGI